MLALKFVLLLVLFALNFIGPGLYVLRTFRWSPGEKFCASVGLSQFIVFVIAFALYWANADQGWYWLIFVVGAISTYIVRDDLRMLWKNHGVRAQVRTFLILLPIALCMLALIREYSGGSWAGDWLEHYQRTIFFLEHKPYDTIFIDLYKLPARPPMMNVLAAAYMAQLGDNSFAIFQLVFVLLNLLVVLPCVLLLPVLGAKHRRFSLAALTFLLAASPMLMENVTWTWTKLMTAFYVLLAVRLYLRIWTPRGSTQVIAAFVSLAIAMVAHYSAGPFIVVLGIHYVIEVLRRSPKRWLEPALAISISIAVLMVWMGWSMAQYGVKETFGSNTSVTEAATSKESTSARVGGNIVDTIVPFIWRNPKAFRIDFAQESLAGTIRDYVFCLYQHNLIFGMGSIGGLIVIYLVVRRLARGGLRVRMILFWCWFIVAAIILGIAVEGTRETYGVAHICLQSLMLLGIVLLAGNVKSLYRWVRVVLLVACIIDFAFRTFLHATLEHRTFYFLPDPAKRAGIVVIAGRGGLGERAFIAWNAKTVRKLYLVGDEFDRSTVVVQIILAEIFAITAYAFWYFCIAERKRLILRMRESWRTLLPRSGLPSGMLA